MSRKFKVNLYPEVFMNRYKGLLNGSLIANLWTTMRMNVKFVGLESEGQS